MRRAALCCRCGHGKTTPPLLISRRRTDNAHSPLDAGRCRYLSCVSFGLDYPSQRGAQRRPFTVRLLCDARTARRACYCRHFDVASAAIAGSTTVSRRRPGGHRGRPRVRHRLTISSAAREMRRTLAIRQVSGDRVVALVEIVSPANKDRPVSVEQFANKAEMALRQGIHVVMADLFPPGPHDPRGMHAAIWERFDEDSHSLPHDEPLTLASYVAGPMPEAYLEHLAAGTARRNAAFPGCGPLHLSPFGTDLHGRLSWHAPAMAKRPRIAARSRNPCPTRRGSATLLVHGRTF